MTGGDEAEMKASDIRHPGWTDEDKQRVAEWFNSTQMCRTCCQRVPKSEVEQGLHEHSAVMD